MSFTKHIKNMKATECPLKLLDELESALRAEMKKHGLLNQPPSGIGYDDWERWDNDSFKNLVYDCYIEAIIKPLPTLQTYIKQGQNIDGVIIQNVHFFIIGKFRNHDKIGYAVAINTKVAVQLSIIRKIIKYDDDADNINSHTLLSFLSCKSTTFSGKEAISSALRNNSAWTPELQLRFSIFKNNDSTKQKFCDIVCKLKDFDIDSFRFKSLVYSMKEFARKAVDDWQAKNIPPDFGEDKILPDETYDNYNSFSYWCKQIREEIEKSYKNDVCEQLHRIFTEYELAIKQRKDTPSQREIASSLDIPASTFHGYIKKLRKVIALVRSNNFE
jgi:hypothetical protein